MPNEDRSYEDIESLLTDHEHDHDSDDMSSHTSREHGYGYSDDDPLDDLINDHQSRGSTVMNTDTSQESDIPHDDDVNHHNDTSRDHHSEPMRSVLDEIEDSPDDVEEDSDEDHLHDASRDEMIGADRAELSAFLSSDSEDDVPIPIVDHAPKRDEPVDLSVLYEKDDRSKDMSTDDKSEDHDDEDDLIPPDFNALRLESERTGGIDEEDIPDLIYKQSLTNRQSQSRISLPVGISMIDEPMEIHDYAKPEAGDEDVMRKVALGIVFLVLSSISGIVTALFINSSKPAPIALPEPQTVAPGSVINQNAQNAADGSGSGSNGSSTPSSAETSVVIPENGHKVVYRVKAEGGITAASVTYLDGRGNPTENTGISLPWEKTIGAKSSVTPQFSVASKGYGTLTCTITVDGSKKSDHTVSGESPTVQCNI